MIYVLLLIKMNYVDNFMFVHQSYNEKENLDGLTY